ncbi:GerMN domain-containing protein [Halalkalibacter nanhaiisediminis]|uniref:Sporulation and spore germination protein n=1 Tax=Halalkalibacter nanhaiisediminis TaxID=688079 RepID=A0A562QKD2_9BACI|nr:GerMN domain-containing protein [Halalkalibacter nanhaiisediminis]TWI57184.1 sporulation and spore germination protein [Halalkalibacter nanhaiisediminis]
MKKHLVFFLLSLFILVLAACGQGTDSTEPEQATDGIEIEENSDLVESDGLEESTAADEEADQSVDSADQSVDSTGESVESNEEEIIAVDEEVVDDATVTPVELVFSDDQVMDLFRVERQIEATDEELFVATLEAWVAGPTEDGLVSLVPANVEVQSVEEIDGVAHVSFSSELLDAQVGSGVEEMLLQQVAMIMKQFGFNETQILIDGEVQPELFGHIDTSEPTVANNPEDYEKVE